jgi:hypothetical protein
MTAAGRCRPYPPAEADSAWTSRVPVPLAGHNRKSPGTKHCTASWGLRGGGAMATEC